MINSLRLNFLLKKTVAVSFYNNIHTHNVLFGSFKRRRKPRRNPDEPGMRHRRKIVQVNSDYIDEVAEEHELDDDFDMMKLDKAFDEDARETKQFRERVQLKITAQKFFSPRPQPPMLTCNERLCIKYLHKQDPVQWNLKTLSESFPATTETIKKVLKSNFKVTPERAKIVDSRVQRNWELLAEGKLDVDPDVLEHLKKFVNRREVLLEQIKNETFYLPEVKPEPVWNQGEMTSIISKYEKEIEKLVQENKPKSITDGSDDVKNEEKKKEESSLDLFHEQIKAESQNLPEMKDSFKFGRMMNTFNRNTTFEEYKNKILQEAENRKELDSLEYAPPGRMMNTFNRNTTFEEYKNNILQKAENREVGYTLEYAPSDENTHSGDETDVWNILNKLENKSENKEVEEQEEKKKGRKEVEKQAEKNKEKKEIDFSDPERKAREDAYYEKEVLHIKNTAFWDNKRTSKEKAMAELEKADHDQPAVSENFVEKPDIFVLSNDHYPERINIPKHKRKPGMTYKVKDCYYDDDGQFLYRVPGMIK